MDHESRVLMRLDWSNQRRSFGNENLVAGDSGGFWIGSGRVEELRNRWFDDSSMIVGLRVISEFEIIWLFAEFWTF